MKKESGEDIEKDIDNTEVSDTDTSAEAETEQVNDSEDSSESKDTADKESDFDDSEEEKSSGKNTFLIVELLIAVAAIVFIIFALVSKNGDRDSVSENNAASNNIVSGDVGNNGPAVIDNSILYEDVPALPALSELNVITEAEAEASVADGTMIKLEIADGGYAYVNNYTDIDYISEQVVPSDEEIDEAVFYNITYYYIEITEGSDHTTVEEGDVVIADYTGELDGVAFGGGSAANVEILVGIGEYIPGFEEGLIGMEIGETKAVPVTFPENYENTDLAGQDVIFTFTVHEISGSYTVPELTDAMVQENFLDPSVTTAEECREYFKDMIMQNNIWDFLIDKYYVTELSEESVLYYYNIMLEAYDQTSISYQMSVADMLSYSGATIDDLKADTILSASYTALESSILNAIADDAGITVSDEDITELAVEYGYTDKETFIRDYGEDTIKEYLLQTNVLDYIVSLL